MQITSDTNRKHNVNHSYFDIVDTEKKAYWLGFLWADGGFCTTAKRSSGPNHIRVSQKWNERNHLEKLKQELNTDYIIAPIMHPNNKCVAQLDINSRTLCQALQRLGYDTKPKRTQIPKMPTHLKRHFIRGYFDGDGCLSIYDQHIQGKWTTHRQEFSITGNIELLMKIKETLTNDAHVTNTTHIKRYKKSPTTISIRYGKKADIIKLYEYMYTDATVFLESKHNKFLQFFSNHK